VNVRKVINKIVRYDADGVSVRSSVQAVVAANVNEEGRATAAAQQRTGDRPPADEGGRDVRHEQ
jgi:hypothetical protein